MGPFTESMTRLRGEIVALRGARLTFSGIWAKMWPP